VPEARLRVSRTGTRVADAARELPLEDALQLVRLNAERGSPKYEKAALRWLEQYLTQGSRRRVTVLPGIATHLPPGSVTGERSDRIVGLNFTRRVPGEALDEVVALARKLELALYDPQGPNFHSPAELVIEPTRRDPAVLRQALVGTLIGAAVLGLGIVLPVPVLDWILIVVGGFIVVMGVYSVAVWLRE
jgi:hypothetical protein